MLKKLLVVSVSGVVLIGCGKKVTADMLIGEWSCATYEVIVVSYNDKGEIIKQYNGSDENTEYLSFKREGTMIFGYSDGEKITSLNLSDATKIEINYTEDNCKLIGAIEQNYTSRNEYQKILNVKCYDISKGFLQWDAHMKYSCTRIK